MQYKWFIHIHITIWTKVVSLNQEEVNLLKTNVVAEYYHNFRFSRVANLVPVS
jgi:hypothetical protein